MKLVELRKEDGDKVTVFNFHNLESAAFSDDGVVEVSFEDYDLKFEGVEEVMRVVDYEDADGSLIVNFVLDAVEDGEAYFYLEDLEDEYLAEAFTRDGLAFREGEEQDFYLFVPESLSGKGFRVPVGNITVVE